MNLSSVRRRVLRRGGRAGVTVGLLAMRTRRRRKPKTNPPGKPVTVMTRNLYLGADIQRPVSAAVAAQAAPGSTTQSVVVALANATHLTRAIVDQTDFTVRAGLLADEIVATEPDLIGLQEVAWWRHGPIQLTPDAARRPERRDHRLRLPGDPPRRPRRPRCGVPARQHRPARRRRGAELHRRSGAPTPATCG